MLQGLGRPQKHCPLAQRARAKRTGKGAVHTLFAVPAFSAVSSTVTTQEGGRSTAQVQGAESFDWPEGSVTRTTNEWGPSTSPARARAPFPNTCLSPHVSFTGASQVSSTGVTN